ncbi:hypothetical protein [Rhodospirillum rubrum]|uniref:Transmembrane protein n=1 Tax=Rhodospirillum rubrum (strain ATCC 11170 / ATH 1.1.1 / DSM 467 / LMG 4362 / NCIMB 8255 / S1) TaxID=269796 RepID=Q2RTD7_RHORT|nr:hypothetical protein [Rhodospirillum rubrum]ABC22608.1 conserved hypothetical protein [Rhodospirillum rubrum ATCC 11170]AEO48326.1 hypothetical protein F11_09300 [Rhodospirillum rubrum F11]MBK5954196.1 hypothetical protein [Rhodospirillum rubrum]QXG82232.1 hypothetical protein KUL73_09365 [Rhodospirillum rubrum]HCF18988.1 hypothetical protein [Rhodospirillum rubrum]
MSVVSVAKNVVRGSGVLALCLGALFVFAPGLVPIHAHMTLGVLLILALWVLAFLGRTGAPRAAVLAAIAGLLLPVLGILQLQVDLGGGLWLVQTAHVVVALGAMGLAEVLAKRGGRA